jgi:hypothetical protein
MGRIMNSVNRFRQYLGRGGQRPLPAMLRRRPRVEELEGRLVPSTLNIDSFNNAVFVGNSTLSSETLTLSEKTVVTPFGPVAERTFTDSADPINVTGPGAGNATGSGTNTVTWFSFVNSGSIQVFMKAYSNVVNLQSMDCGTYITQTQGHDLTVNLGNSDNGVQSILGLVGVDPGPGESLNLNVDDAADTGDRPNVTFNGGYLDNLAPAPIHVGAPGPAGLYLLVKGGKGTNTFTITNTEYEQSPDYGHMTLVTGGGNATVNVQGTSAPLNVVNDGALDIVNIGSAAPNFGGTLANIYGQVSVVGTGSTSLFIDDSGDTQFRYVGLSASSLTGLSPALIYWTASPAATGGVTSLTILGTAAGSTYYVINTPNLHYNTELDTGAGPDTVVIDATTSRLDVFNKGGQDYVYVGNGTLAGVSGNVSAEGYGSTWLYVDDQADTTSHTATLTDKQLSGLSTGVISWNASSSSTGGVTQLEINGGVAASTYTVTNTPNAYYGTYLDLGNGATDVVFVSGTTGNINVLNGMGAHADVFVTGNGTLAPINGAVDVYGAGATYLYVEDIYDTNARTAILTTNSLTGLSPAPIEWTASPSSTGGGVTELVLYGSAANNTYDVASIPNSYYGTTVLGGSGTNTLVGPNTTNTWTITGADAGSLNGGVSFSGIANLVGGSGVDTFRFTAAASQVASINGGGAPSGQGDWLDYTAFPSAVAVNLGGTTVNGVNPNSAKGVTGTVHKIQNVFGGNFGNTLAGDGQGNILIGGAGTNLITGGTGASLLIGGKGNATVVGGSGGDILIGGFTTYDQTHNEAALMSILAEWQLGGSYPLRLFHLRHGGGLNGPNTLNLGTTVIDPGSTDALTGGTFIPGALDWFFEGAHDTIHHFESGEQIN